MTCSLNIQIRPVTSPDVPAISTLARVKFGKRLILG